MFWDIFFDCDDYDDYDSDDYNDYDSDMNVAERERNDTAFFFFCLLILEACVYGGD
jgi:hypothetical protein